MVCTTAKQYCPIMASRLHGSSKQQQQQQAAASQGQHNSVNVNISALGQTTAAVCTEVHKHIIGQPRHHRHTLAVTKNNRTWGYHPPTRGVPRRHSAAPSPFRPGNPALRGSHPLVTPYYCRLGDLLCFVFICVLIVLFC